MDWIRGNHKTPTINIDVVSLVVLSTRVVFAVPDVILVIDGILPVAEAVDKEI